ncbi:hypothetical protein F4805DRAFT_53087 [Annulohypoxylon moriforme]|nr:hypothetical protein F4805DRAFT_53087 [Annulohypoxylon moriforme]
MAAQPDNDPDQGNGGTVLEYQGQSFPHGHYPELFERPEHHPRFAGPSQPASLSYDFAQHNLLSYDTNQDQVDLLDFSFSPPTFPDDNFSHHATPSYGSDQPIPLRASRSQHWCLSCVKVYSQKKNLNRHLRKDKAYLGVNSLYYHCACGMKCPRKDNYKRHLQLCRKEGNPDEHYTCICRQAHIDKGAQLDHMEYCGSRGSRLNNL